MWLASDAADLRSDAVANDRMAPAYGLAFLSTNDIDFSQSEIIVDALFDTGLDRPVTGDPAKVIDAVKNSRK